MRDIIVGGGGWVSKAGLSILLNKFDADLQSTKVYGSSPRIENLHNGEVIKVEQWGLNIKEYDVRFFLPFAFLTADKFQEYGEEKYRELNRELIQRAAKFIASNGPKYCVLFSSGIVHSNLSISYRPKSYKVYRELKLEEEETLRLQCQKNGTNLVICRLFSASGRYIPDYVRYAISNFVYQGIFHKKIEISSAFPVFRKYIDMEQLLEICLTAVQNERVLEFDSTGSLIELQDLATLCAEKLGIKYEKNSLLNGEADNYFSQSQDSELLAELYEIPLFSMERQIKETIAGVYKIIRNGQRT